MKYFTLALYAVVVGVASTWAADLAVEVQVSTAVVDRVAVGAGSSFAADIPQLVGWCRVKRAKEPIEIYHSWKYEGREQAKMKLPVRSSNYRVWSYFSPRGRKGAWTLDVLDWDNNVLASTSFEIR